MKIFRLSLNIRIYIALGVSILLLCMLILNSGYNNYNLDKERAVDCTRAKAGLQPNNIYCRTLVDVDRANPMLYCLSQNTGIPSETEAFSEVNCAKFVPNDVYSFTRENTYKVQAQNSIFAGLIIFLILSIPAFYLNERSKGWRRASLVISIAISLTSFLILSFSPKKYHLDISPWLFAMVCFVALIISLLKGKSLYEWIKDGFIQDKTPDSTINFKDTFGTKNISSTRAEPLNTGNADKRATHTLEPTTALKKFSIMNWSKGALAAVGGFLILFFALIVGKSIGLVATDKMSDTTHSRGDKSSVIRKLSDKMNKQLPDQLDQFTRIDSTSAGPGNLITYYYTLTEFDADPAALPAAREKAREIIRSVCIGSGRKMLNDGITMEYIYRDRKGNEFTRFEITKADCKSL